MELYQRLSLWAPVKQAKPNDFSAPSPTAALMERLSICVALIEQGQSNTAVAKVCDITLELLNTDNPYRSMLVECLPAWPVVGTTLTDKDGIYTIEPNSKLFTAMQARAYVRFLYQALNKPSPSHKPGIFIDIANRIAHRVDKLAQKLCLTNSSDDGRAYLYYSAYYKHVLHQSLSNTASHHREQQLVASISKYLREPVVCAYKCLIKNQAENRLVEMRRNQVLEPGYIKNYSQKFKIPRLTQYQELLKTDTRSRIIASFHMGDYVYGIYRLLCLEPQSRSLHIIRQQTSSFANYHNFLRSDENRLVPRTVQILASRFDPAKVVAQLRKGNSSLVTLCDLPSLYGETVPVTFLGRQAQFPKAPATLAMVAKVPLLPVINYFDGADNIIQLGNMIEVQRKTNESAQQCVKRLTQLLVNFFEEFVLRYPEQWRYLPVLAEYFDTDKQSMMLGK